MRERREREHGQRDPLHDDARAHQFVAVFGVEFAAFDEGNQTDAEDGEGGKHGDDHGDKKES